jgi:hypothetical protein
MLESMPFGLSFIRTMPAAGVAAVAAAKMIGLCKDHVRALHVEVFRPKVLFLG